MVPTTADPLPCSSIALHYRLTGVRVATEQETGLSLPKAGVPSRVNSFCHGRWTSMTVLFPVFRGGSRREPYLAHPLA